MDHWQRNFAYGTGCLVIGLAVVVFTNRFIPLADEPGFTGYFVLFAFGLAFFSLCFSMNRRFLLKSDRHMLVNYLFSFLIVGPTLFWALTKNTALDNTLLVFTLVCVLTAYLGTFAGSRYGVSKRDALRKQAAEDEELPKDLKRPHDEINRN